MGEQSLLLESMESLDYFDLRMPEISTHYLKGAIGRMSHFFRRLCDVVARESCRLVPKVNGRKLKPEDFELSKDNKSGRAVYAKIYLRKPGKAKCRISLKSPKNTIPVEDLMDKNFERSCILKLHHAYLG